MSRTTEMDAAWLSDTIAKKRAEYRRGCRPDANSGERRLVRLKLPLMAHEAVTESRAVKLGGWDE